MKKAHHIISIGIIILLSSCSSRNLMKYYYPINQKPEVKIYKYVNPNNSELNEYWRITTDPVNKSILTESFNSKLKLYNTFKEEVNKEEAVLLEFIEFEGEQIVREINANVKKNEVYKSNKSQPYNYSVEYTNRYGRFTFEKKRQFVELKEIEINGKKYQTAKFKDEYFINAIDQKGKYEFNQVAYYAKGIGMVKYERFIPTGEIRILELEKILTEKEFDEMKKKASR